MLERVRKFKYSDTKPHSQHAFLQSCLYCLFSSVQFITLLKQNVLRGYFFCVVQIESMGLYYLAGITNIMAFNSILVTRTNHSRSDVVFRLLCLFLCYDVCGHDITGKRLCLSS